MVDGFCMHRLNNTEIVDYLRRMVENVAYPSPRFAVLLEPIIGSYQGKGRLTSSHPCQSLPFTDRVRQFLPHVLIEEWFVIERFQLRRRTVLEQVDNPLCLGSKMGEDRKSTRLNSSHVKIS